MSLFDQLKPEEEQEIRKCRVERNPELEEIIRIYEEKVKPHIYKHYNLAY